MQKLIIKRPSGEELELVLSEPEYSLGRAIDNDIPIEDTDVSRYHCRLRRGDDGYIIEDLHSHNGTYLNGRRIEKAVLKDGDQLQAGHHLITYRIKGAPAAASPSVLNSIEEDYDQLVTQLTSSAHNIAAVDGGGESMARLEKEHKTLRLMLDLGYALSAEHSVEDVCRKATRILLEATEAERAVIFLLDQDQKTLNRFTTSDRNDSAATKPAVLSRTIAERILRERKGIITSNAAIDERFAHGRSVIASGLRSVACAPLLGKAGNLGILYMENNTAVGAFTHEDLQLLCAVAAQIGLAIENARFFEALRLTNENLERLVEERTAALAATQLKLYQAEKIASLSRLVAGVAHEINNPLGALKSNLDLLTAMFERMASSPGKSRKEAGEFENLAELGQTSAAACARIVAVVRSLSSFAHLDEAAFKPANVNESIRNAVRLLDPALTRHVRITLELGEVPAIPCYPALINEALMNLLVNACQAIKESGEVTIETRSQDDSVIIRIRDTGCGIAREHLQTIFDPGFTTKGAGVGIGLGLAVAYGVIAGHHGSIGVESELNRGSVFTVRLPAGQPASAA